MGEGARSLRYSSLAAAPEGVRRLAEAQGRAAAREPETKTQRAGKFNNHPTTVDGVRFDSKREARYYEQLKIRRAAGEVSFWLRQVPLHLPGGTRYVLDFLVFFTDAARPLEWIDVKGRETAMFRVKRREIEHHYPIRITLT